MSTPRVYLDTSVISHLDQPEKQLEQHYSLLLWQSIINGEYDVWLSEVVFEELNRCEAAKRERLIDFLSHINYHRFSLNTFALELSNRIIEKNILPASCANDSKHIAGALISDCNYLLSWNLKHLANFRTNERMRLVFFEEFKRELAIATPMVLFDGRIII
jgi:predicted nucleic acid-binding protein